jgi:acetyltransferase-like isoleucine patch superfamily enzyme
MFNLKAIIKRYIVKKILFFHYKEPYIKGDPKNLILVDKKTNTLNNTIFNTRNGKIVLEKGVFFGHNCMVLTGKHNYSFDINKRYKISEEERDIYIKEGAWIASGAIINGGVTVGKYSIVAAGAVVTKDVPDYCLVAGVPAKVIKNLKEEK